MIVHCKLFQLSTQMSQYVTVFAKRTTNLDFEFCIQRESTLDELPVALYCTLLAGSSSEIHSLKVRNYEHSVFCHVTNDVIA